MRQSFALGAAGVLMSAGMARAQVPAPQPDLVSIGAGFYDFTRVQLARRAVEFRAEYRWGVSLLPLLVPALARYDSAVQVHPIIGAQASTRGQTYGFAGLAVDGYVTPHLVLTLSEALGVYGSGHSESLGSMTEFRSQGEIAYQFDTGMRLSTYFSHLSNAGVGRHNTGAESAGLYLHVPVRMLTGAE